MRNDMVVLPDYEGSPANFFPRSVRVEDRPLSAGIEMQVMTCPGQHGQRHA
jgi:hypothetical protein